MVGTNYKTRIISVCNMLYNYIIISKILFFRIKLKQNNLAGESTLLSLDGKNLLLLKIFCLSGSVFKHLILGGISVKLQFKLNKQIIPGFNSNLSISPLSHMTSGLELVGCMRYNNLFYSTNNTAFNKGSNL
jgi:hypothetical protein